MKPLRRLILIFAVGLAFAHGYLGFQAYRSLEAEEAATFGFFAEALFDAMQASAADLIRREEARPVDAYSGPAAAALSGLPAEDYIRGYFQNDPDGGFQTPHRGPSSAAPAELAARLAELEEANRVFNRRRAEGTDRVRPDAPPYDLFLHSDRIPLTDIRSPHENGQLEMYSEECSGFCFV